MASTQRHSLILSTLTLLLSVAQISMVTSRNPDVEAFFQGHCKQGLIPCHHQCVDLPPGGFKCTCKEGYSLHHNGFSCLEVTRNPATTVPSLLHDLDAAEVVQPGSSSSEQPQGKVTDEVDDEVDDEVLDRLPSTKPGSGAKFPFLDSASSRPLSRHFGVDADEQSLEDLAEVAEVAQELDSLPRGNEDPDDQSDTGSAGNIDPELQFKNYGGEVGEDDMSITKRQRKLELMEESELEDLSKKGRYQTDLRGKARYRGKSGRRRLNKQRGKNRNKGKGKNKNKVTLKPYKSSINIMEDAPSLYHSEPAEDKAAVENEVDPRRHRTCAELQCRAGGWCVPDTMRQGVRCQCQLGTEGDYCEKDVMVKYPRFRGTGYEAFPVLRGAYKDFTISIEFRPDTDNGLLMFSGDFPSVRSDFFSIALLDGQVEFRFDCGTGAARVRTKNSVKSLEWNTVTVHRTDWDGWVQLNDGAQERGRSKGPFSRITFREDLYLGGYKNTSVLGLRTGMQWGFVGCVRHLTVNNRVYDMRKGAFVGDAIHGMDVGECSANVCDGVKCLNSGACQADSADSSVCLCPTGTAGDRCESRIDIHVPSFSGTSYLQFLGLRQMVLSYLQVELVLKPASPNGLILYNGYTSDRTGDFISLCMRDGYLEFRFDLGTGPAIIRSPHPISLNEWHVVRFSRTGRDGNLQVDNQAAVEGLSQGAYTQLTLTLDLFIGGHRNYDEVAKAARMSESFKGCIQKVTINERQLKLIDDAITGVNIDNCNHPCVGQPCLNGGRCVPIKDYYKCSCPLGFENTNCEDRIVRYRYRYRYRRDVKEQITVPMFSGDSYLMYMEHQMITKVRGKKVDIQMRLKATSPDGLLFWTSEEQMTDMSDFMALGLSGGHVHFRYNLGDGEVTIPYMSKRVDDGEWHKIRAQRLRRVGYLEVDGTEIVEGESPGKLEQLNTFGVVYLGGLEDVPQQTLNKYQSGLVGCISNLTLATDYPVDLMNENSDGRNIEQCDA